MMNKLTILCVAIVVLLFACLPYISCMSTDGGLNVDDLLNFDDKQTFAAGSQGPAESSDDPDPSHAKTLAIVLGVIGGITFVGLVLIVVGAVGYVYVKQRTSYEAL